MAWRCRPSAAARWAFVSKSARPELLVDTLQSCGRAARDKASLQGAMDDAVHADG